MAQDLWSTPDRGIRPGQQAIEDPLQSEFRSLLALDNNPPVSHDTGETDYLPSVIPQKDQKVGKHKKKSKHSTSRTSTGREAVDVLANTAPVGGSQSTSESATPAPPATPAAAPVLSQIIKCLNFVKSVLVA